MNALPELPEMPGLPEKPKVPKKTHVLKKPKVPRKPRVPGRIKITNSLKNYGKRVSKKPEVGDFFQALWQMLLHRLSMRTDFEKEFGFQEGGSLRLEMQV